MKWRPGYLLLTGIGIELCLILSWMQWEFGNWWVPHRFFWAASVPALATAGLAAWRAANSRSLVVVPFLAGAVYALAIGIFLLGAEVFAPTVATGCLEHTEATGGFGDRICFGPLPIVSMDALSAAKDALRTGGTYTLYSIPLVLLAHGIGRLMRAPAAEPVAAPDAPRR